MLACRSVHLPWWGWLLASSALLFLGCSPKIGDDCSTSTDCSLQGDRLCDISQPGGYCTVFNCEPASCPEEAACVAFDTQLDSDPACYDPTQRNRLERRFCMFVCSSNSDCRSGYVCAGSTQLLSDFSAVLAEDNQGLKICIRAPFSSSATPASTEVCQPPPFTLDVPYYDSSSSKPDSGVDLDSSPDASPDDGGADGSVEDAEAGN